MSRQQAKTEYSAPYRAGLTAVRVAGWVVDLFVLLVFLLIVVFGAWAIHDENHVYETGSTKVFEQYKPVSEEEVLSFNQLIALNPDVFGWLTVYGTHMDYPVVQGETNHEYINKDAAGNFALSGALFLDSENSRAMNDFHNIIYGHHMDKNMMFGDLDYFAAQSFLDEHKYGNFFYDGRNHGVEFFAFLPADAYDGTVYNCKVTDGERMEFLEGIRAKAVSWRELDGAAANGGTIPLLATGSNEHILTLSTCASGTSNQRYLLLGRLTESTFENTFAEDDLPGEDTSATATLRGWWERLPNWWYIAILVLCLLLLLALLLRRRRRKEDTKPNEGA